jgi:hypothetical protein
VTEHYTYHGERRLLYAPIEDPKEREDVEYLRRHGETREQTAARNQALQRQQIEAEAIADLSGEPPAAICNAKGLLPAQALYVRYSAWKQQIEQSLLDLQSKKTELEAMVAAVGPVKAERWTGVRRTADAMLGRAESSGEGNAKALADRVAIAEHRAEAAKIALEELASLIDRAELRVKHIGERESEYLFPALVEAAEKAGLFADYVECVARLSDAAGWVFGLAALAPYGSGFSRPQGPIVFPGVPSKSGPLTVDHRGTRDIWDGLADTMRKNPRANIAKLINPNAPRRGEGAR